MKLPVLAALMVSVALAAPADAASGKKKPKPVHRTDPAAANSQDVYVGSVLTGRDPDPNIRAYLRRSPSPWDGPD